MRIGLDIDDTMTNSSETIIEYAKNYFQSSNIDYINELIHVDKIEGKVLDFYNDCLPEMMPNYALKDNVKEVIDRLRLKGHQVIGITVRGYATMKEKSVEITEEYFKKHQIVLDEIIFRARNKSVVCEDKKIEIMIDDSLRVLNEVKEKGVRPLLFTSSTNQLHETEIEKVSTWLELEKYIDQLSSNNMVEEKVQ